ncbi:MAG: hypothetical protein H6818_13885 [Phycisphaerales bacterium]|nr:hypothetical protein [Phycisphaerales bacterium]MCB9862107.1 hypothetical protein [Phycisphaerales bacterium]
MAAADKIMFEIYREAGYDQKFRVVYFTELDEHNKHNEINRAMSGEHFFDGFIKELGAERGKARINEFIQRLNDGEKLTPEEVEAGLSETGVLAD